MSDDLVKRLRKGVMCGDDPIVDEAADRIEKLEAELHSCFHRIEELQAALRDCVNVLACFERPDFYQLEQTSPIKPYALGALDVARKALEGGND